MYALKKVKLNHLSEKEKEQRSFSRRGAVREPRVDSEKKR